MFPNETRDDKIQRYMNAANYHILASLTGLRRLRQLPMSTRWLTSVYLFQSHQFFCKLNMARARRLIRNER